jgi:hypothetical protein
MIASLWSIDSDGEDEAFHGSLQEIEGETQLSFDK